jgi:signal transduction histidine kinase
VNLPETQEISSIQMEHLLSITKEALSNVIRHARAQSVSLKALLVDHSISITIEDNGIGLPTQFSTGYGLRNMRDRARLIGGGLEIFSEPEKGTTVILTFPVKEC